MYCNKKGKALHYLYTTIESYELIHCGMVPNGVADSIEFQLTSLRGIEVLACSFDTNFNYSLFWQ